MSGIPGEQDARQRPVGGQMQAGQVQEGDTGQRGKRQRRQEHPPPHARDVYAALENKVSAPQRHSSRWPGRPAYNSSIADEGDSQCHSSQGKNIFCPREVLSGRRLEGSDKH